MNPGRVPLPAAVELLDRSLAYTRVLLADVRPDNLDRPTPCEAWTVRGMEIRGRAEAVTGVPRDEGDFRSGEVIRIRPRRIRSWGVPDGEAGSARWTPLPGTR